MQVARISIGEYKSVALFKLALKETLTSLKIGLKIDPQNTF